MQAVVTQQHPPPPPSPPSPHTSSCYHLSQWVELGRQLNYSSSSETYIEMISVYIFVSFLSLASTVFLVFFLFKANMSNNELFHYDDGSPNVSGRRVIKEGISVLQDSF